MPPPIMSFLNPTTRAWISALGILLSALTASADSDPEGEALLKDARERISAYHSGRPASNRRLRVVYFVPADRDPLPNHAERLNRILDDVSGFYRDGMRRFGIESDGLPLEKKDGKLVIHLVRGELPASEYHHESGRRTTMEIHAALKGTVDLFQEHVLVLYALCSKEPDGRYIFDAPYYGDASSSNQRGLCHAADCELLDPLLLTEKDKRIVFTSHYHPRMEQTVATFNSWYLGGIAHELGHGLGLPHDSGSHGEKGFGTSLMGGGNLHYREDLWGGGSPSFLSRASALQLASHPLFTGSDHGRPEAPDGYFDTLDFADRDGNLSISGTVAGSVPPYAVVAYAWPANAKTDHGAISFPVVLKDGAFKLELAGLGREDHRLKLASLHVNGAEVAETFELQTDPAGHHNIAGLTAEWLVDRAEMATLRGDARAREFVSDEILATAPTPEAVRKLKVLRSLLDPAAPAELSTINGPEAFLSDAAWTEAKVGWGKPVRNGFWFDARFQRGAFLMLGGEFHDKGLYAHAPSRYVFPVDQKWKTFTATIGLRDGADGSAVFIIRGDGKELHRSRILRAREQESVTADISLVKNLELLTEGGAGQPHGSWSVWVDPKVGR